MTITADRPTMSGVYWRCPECDAACVVTIPNPLAWLSTALGIDTDNVLDFDWLAMTELAHAEAVVEDHEDGHLLWRDFESSTR